MLARTVEVHKQVSISLVVAAPLVSFLMSRVNKPWLVGVLLVAQLSVASLTWFVGQSRAKLLETERIDARSETLVALGDALDPVLLELGRVAVLSKPDRRHERSGLLTTVLSAAVVLGDEGSRPRSSYFRLDNELTRRLVHEKSHGRSVPAKAEFVAGTVAGDTALKMVDHGEELFCDDVGESPPPGWEPSKRGEYKTFISVSVRTGNLPWGMLTLDACEVGALTVEDVKMMRALGHLLGVIEQLTA